jgi:Flp pilus assembly protein TadD
MAQLLAPLVLSADYSHAQVPIVSSWWAPRALAGGVLLAGIGLVVCTARPAVAFAALFPLLTLALTSNLLFPIGTIRGERLLYLPSVGWSLLVAVLIHAVARRTMRSALFALVVGVWIAALAGRTWIRNADWRDDMTLHRQTVHAAPFSAKARLNYGIALQRAGQHAAALAQFQKALALYPWEEAAANGIGRALEQSGRPAEAEAWYVKALEIEPAYRPAHSNLCRLYLAKQRYAEAAAACRRGLRLDPTDANLLKGLGASLLGAGDADKAQAVLRRAAVWNPRDPELRAALGGGQAP